ncbi:unnamed protein product [Vitrella brassicaformis CCMP3155]|uniref:Uncharacterized protein n=1 Tax=Vitrella brassicaformis (strain CCMP3155) TaxID=1169540 RepID=A0A0G4EU26_VITBC|nr:unnamed protein product [Vitrella brassicaformis CCMP3155]|eukprot:CEM01900.1 unnamed protein product [Vitrella brassicaformis CCMP3155]
MCVYFGRTIEYLCLSLASTPTRLQGVHNHLVKMQLSYRVHRQLFDRLFHHLAATHSPYGKTQKTPLMPPPLLPHSSRRIHTLDGPGRPIPRRPLFVGCSSLWALPRTVEQNTVQIDRFLATFRRVVGEKLLVGEAGERRPHDDGKRNEGMDLPLLTWTDIGQQGLDDASHLQLYRVAVALADPSRPCVFGPRQLARSRGLLMYDAKKVVFEKRHGS